MLGWFRYQWHKRVLRHVVRGMVFNGRYTRMECVTCATHFWQMPGLFSRR